MDTIHTVATVTLHEIGVAMIAIGGYFAICSTIAVAFFCLMSRGSGHPRKWKD